MQRPPSPAWVVQLKRTGNRANAARGEELKNRLSPITINPVAISSGGNKTLDLSAESCFGTAIPLESHRTAIRFPSGVSTRAAGKNNCVHTTHPLETFPSRVFVEIAIEKCVPFLPYSLSFCSPEQGRHLDNVIDRIRHPQQHRGWDSVLYYFWRGLRNCANCCNGTDSD